MKTKPAKLKTAEELGITPTQHRNIARLCLFVKDKVPPPKFDIKTWHRDEKGEQCAYPARAKYECGTSACFLGYAPLAGIEPEPKEYWDSYAARGFGAKEYYPMYRLLFHSSHLNNKTAAVRRGAYFLTHGIPEDDVPLSTWEAPKSFRPDWAQIREAAAL